MPLFGVKTLLALGAAWLLRCNKIAAVITVSLHHLLILFAPVILGFEYEVGSWILSHPHHLPESLGTEILKHPAELLHWSMFFKFGGPLLMGGLVLAVPLSAITYGLSYWLVSRHQAKRAARESMEGAGI